MTKPVSLLTFMNPVFQVYGFPVSPYTPGSGPFFQHLYDPVEEAIYFKLAEFLRLALVTDSVVYELPHDPFK